jgi:hypothetical protein
MDKMNINDYVWVKLTDKGREILKAGHDTLRASYPKTIKEWVDPTDPKTGYAQFQLHEIMYVFGEHCGLGFVVPFDTEIRLTKPDNAKMRDGQ